MNRSTRIIRALAAAAVLPALASCSDVAAVRDVRATILDEEGRPIPGAVFWAESSDETGPFGWLVDVAGQAGEIPDSAREPLKIAWRPGARLMLAAFAPGRIPAILGGGEERVTSDGAVLVLRPRSPGAASPPLDALAFPFEDAPELAAEVRSDPSWTRLEAAYRDALGAREAAGPALSPAERRKAQALDAQN